MKISGAIFDMDGTLIDSLGFWDVLWRELGKRYKNDESFVPDKQVEKDVRTLPLADAMELLHSRHDLGNDGAELLAFTNEMLISFYRDQVEIKPGAYEFLSALKQRGIKACIASATAKNMLEIVVKKFGFDKLVCGVFSCADIGRGKEFPDIFIEAHNSLGTPMESTWVFDDSAVAVETAHNAGFNTVGVYDKYSPMQERVKAASVIYMDESKSFIDLIDSIEV